MYKSVVRPLLFLLDPEVAHLLAHKAMPMAKVLEPMSRKWHGELPTSLRTVIGRTEVSNPVGLAAGFDKNGKLTEFLSLLGFGFAEIGSITGKASAGNPKPRLFRLPDDQAIINYLGLNGEGAQAVAARLEQAKPSLPIAVNIAKTNDPTVVGDAAVEDMLTSFNCVKNLNVSYVAINVSCPNTHETKLAEVGMIRELLQEIGRLNQNALPTFLKLSPDSDKELLEQIVSLSRDQALSGFVCGNTTVDRAGLRTPESVVSKIGPGGLSGPPLKEKALRLCRQVFELKERNQQIIACGGIASGADAFRFIASGANAVEIYTALVYEGPFAPFSICRQLAEILAKENLTVIEAIGSGLELGTAAK